MAQQKEHPIAYGVIAMVSVTLAIVLIVGAGALLMARVLGLDGDAAVAGDSSSGGGETMYLPTPEATAQSTGPLVTLEPEPEDTATASSPGATGLTLVAAQTQVAPMEQIDLTGSYPGSEGAVLQVQRLVGGDWVDFPVNAQVSDGRFSTYIQTGQIGPNRLRMIDTDSGTTSNEVVVRVG